MRQPLCAARPCRQLPTSISCAAAPRPDIIPRRGSCFRALANCSEFFSQELPSFPFFVHQTACPPFYLRPEFPGCHAMCAQQDLTPQIKPPSCSLSFLPLCNAQLWTCWQAFRAAFVCLCFAADRWPRTPSIFEWLAEKHYHCHCVCFCKACPRFGYSIELEFM